MAAPTYSLEALEKRTGVTAATLRHWMKQRVLPPPRGKGRASHYNEGHVLRALVTKQLRAQKQAIAEIRARIGPLTDSELLAMLPPSARGGTTAEGLPVPPPATSYPFRDWQVVELAKGLVLMVDATQDPMLRRVADEIFKYYGSRRLSPG